MVKRAAALVLAVLVLAGCNRMLLAPTEGGFVNGATVTASGKIPDNLALGGTLLVNGIEATVAPDRSWSVEVPASPAGTVTPIEAVYTDPSGKVLREHSAVVSGPSIPAGAASPDGVGMKFNNSGLAALGPVINDLASSAFDISGLLLAQNPLVQQNNAFLTVDVTGSAYEAGAGGVQLAATSTASGIRTDITIQDLYVGLNLTLSDGLLLNLNCRLELQIPSTTISATFDLRPAPGAPHQVDVNLVGTPSVNTGSVHHEFISGVCDGDVFLIGDIVNAVAGPQVSNMVRNGFGSQLGDPDGAGPADSPIADAFESALADISIAGSVGEALTANLDAPFTQITETASGIDMRANADFFATFGTGPTDCAPVVGAPRLPATFDVPGPYPTLGATTPSGTPYGLGLVISSSAFNQLLGAMTECGMLNRDITEISLGGGAPIPINSTVLSLLVPEFASLPPATPIVVRLTPYYSPFLTSSSGPSGEPSELVLADLHVDFVQPAPTGDVTWLRLGVDAPLGFDLAFDAGAGALAPTITAPPASAVTARVLANKVGADQAAVEALFPGLFPSFVDGLGSSFAAFPLPSFLGLNLDVVEVARSGSYFTLFADLAPVPQTRIENVALTNLSTPNKVVDSLLDVHEWRHRIRTKKSPSQIAVDYKGVIGADACCFSGDEEVTAHAGYRLTFDVVPANGDTWRLDLSQLIQGAHNKDNEDSGGGSTSFQSAITGRARIGAGAWSNFNVTPSANGVSGNGSAYAPFTGSNALVLQGTAASTITVEFGFDLRAFSDSTVFPPVAGDEVAIRFGANDTITNGYTAGEYPGVGSRNILTDGHFAVISLSTL